MVVTSDSQNKNYQFYCLAILATLLFIGGFFPVFQILVEKWARSEEYAHAFLAVPIIGYMVWCKKDIFHKKQEGNIVFGLPLVIISIILYLISLQLQIPTVSSLTLVFTLISVLIYLAGFGAIKELITPIILLIIIIPIPNQIYSTITLPLQLKVSQVSEAIIHLLNIPVMREGNILHIPGRTFQVVEACSGLRSMITLLTLSLIMGYFMLTKAVLRVLLTCMSLPVAFFINIIRVVSLVLAYHYLKLDLAVGTPHTILGLVVFGIALVLLLLFQRIFES